MTDQRYALLEGTNVDDVPIPMIGLGTWQFGSREWGYGPDFDAQATQIVRRAIQALAEGRSPGDITTIEDLTALEQIGAALQATGNETMAEGGMKKR